MLEVFVRIFGWGVFSLSTPEINAVLVLFPHELLLVDLVHRGFNETWRERSISCVCAFICFLFFWAFPPGRFPPGVMFLRYIYKTPPCDTISPPGGSFQEKKNDPPPGGIQMVLRYMHLTYWYFFFLSPRYAIYYHYSALAWIVANDWFDLTRTTICPPVYIT